MKTIVLFLVFSLSTLTALAQQREERPDVLELNKKALELNGRNLSNKDSIAKVLDLLDKAISLDNKSVITYGNKINILKFNHRYDEALKTLDEAIDHNPKEYGLYLMKGAVLEKLGRKEESVPIYQKGLELCEARLKQNPTVGTFVDCYLLRYCVNRIDIPNSEVIATIPPSFSEEDKESTVKFMTMIGSIKKFQSEFVKSDNASSISKSPSKPQKREDGVFLVVDELAEFPGGTVAMQKFIVENFKRPANANAGVVLVSFVINTDGTNRDAKIVCSVNKEADNEALRVVGLMPKWKPAKVGGKAVSMVCNIPFRIQ